MALASKERERLGVRLVMNCGVGATVIGYRNANHMTIRFDDGYIVEDLGWDRFERGEVRHPYKQRGDIIKMANDRIGEQKTMNCGVDAIIVYYETAHKMMVMFSDGSTKWCKYREFVAGEVQCPSVKKKHHASALRSQRLREKRLHSRSMMNCGMECEIVEYTNAKDGGIVVRFDDGMTLTASWHNFTTHSIHNPNLPLCICINNSKGEVRIRDFLDRADVPFQRQKVFSDLRGAGNCYLAYDFYLPEHNLLIEYQGEFYDGTLYKKNPNGLQTKEKFDAQVMRDMRKREYAKSHNIRLLEIWYWDFDNISKILEKELILCS